MESECYLMRVAESLGTLKSYSVDEQSMKSWEFVIKINKIYEAFECGTKIEYDMCVMRNGINKDFEINGFKISYIFTMHRRIVKTYDTDSRFLTIEGIDPESNEFSVKIPIPKKVPIKNYGEYIIFAILLLGAAKDKDKFRVLWKFLITSETFDTAETMDIIVKNHPLLVELCNKYPFMKKCVSEGLEKRIVELHEGLKILDLNKFKI